MGLGGYPAVGLATARDIAANCRKTVAAGGDPIAERRGATAVVTFGDFADRFIEDRRSGWRNERHYNQWVATLRDYAAPLRGKPVAAITTEDVLRVLKPLWATRRETGSRLRGRIEMVLDAAKAKGHREGENPARWRGHLDHLLPRRQRLAKGNLAAMPYTDVPAFLAGLRARPLVSSLALEFIILTASRSGEALNATWSEVDIDQAVWTVPKERMKAGRNTVSRSPRGRWRSSLNADRSRQASLSFPVRCAADRCLATHFGRLCAS